MSVTSARFKSKVIRRRMDKTRSKQVVLLDKLVDQTIGGESYDPQSDESATTSPYTLIGTVGKNNWTVDRMGRSPDNRQLYRFEFLEKGIVTPDVMQRCVIAFGNEVHEVIQRDEPIGERDLKW